MPAPTYVPGGSPPSLYAIAAVLEGENGGWPRVVGNTAVRAGALLPGVWLGLQLTGARPRFSQVAVAALTGSAAITLLLFAMYAVKRAEA